MITEVTSKAAVLNGLYKEHRLLAATLATVTPETLANTPIFADGWLVKDMIAHITAWEGQLLVWLEMAANGTPPQMPKGAGWNDYIPPFNERHYTQDKPLSIQQVLAQYETVFTAMTEMIMQQSDEADNPFWALWADGLDPWRLLYIWVHHLHDHHTDIRQALGVAAK